MRTRLALAVLWLTGLCACESSPPPLPPNTPPSLTLESPGTGAQPRVGDSVELIAHVEDAEEGSALGERVLWVSSLSGQLARGTETRGSFSQPGEQTLTATVTDSQGEAASASVTLLVLAADAPTAAVLSPAPGSTFNLGEPLELVCEARAVSGTLLTGEAIQWASALSGPLPSGARVQASLSTAGEDTLSCTATDPATKTSTTTSVRITVKPTQAPAVLITRPVHAEAYVKAGEPVPFSPTVLFRATAQDFNTLGGAGNLDASIQWTLEPGGTSLGSGASATYTFTAPGAHTVTASVTDSLGNQARDSVRVFLVTNLPPACDITQPREDNARLELGDASELAARCEDPETGVALAPTWSTSAATQPLGSGAELSVILSVAGPQTLSACAVDPDDSTLSGCASRSVRTITPTAPTGCAIHAPGTDALLPAGVSLALEGSATDAEDPQSDLRYVWTSNRDGTFALGASASGQLTTQGMHNLTLTVTDPWGMSCTASLNVRVNGAPQARITSVAQGSTDCLTAACSEGQLLTATGSATDAPEGVAGLEWLDDLADGLGSAPQATLPSPIAGKHTLVLRATDTGAAVGRDAATITVLPAGRSRLADTLLDNGKPVSAIALLPGEVRYLEDEAPSVFRYPAPPHLPISDVALCLFPLTVSGGPVLFVGTQTGLERCTSGSCTVFRGGPLSAASNRVNTLAALESPDLLLLGTDKGIVLTRASNPAAGGRPGTVVGRRILDGVKVRQVVISPASSATQVKAWAATTEGLAELTIPVESPFEPALALATAVLHVPPALPEKDVLAVTVSPTGRVFAGTARGFSTPGQLGPSLKAAPWSLQDEVAQVLLFERRGDGATAREVLWVGTRSGLIRYDVTRDIVTRYDAADGLPGEDIRSLALGADGTKYIGTARGLASYAGP